MSDARWRKEFLKCIEMAWGRVPEQRFMQMLMNALNPPHGDPFFIKDEDVMLKLGMYIGEIDRKKGEKA